MKMETNKYIYEYATENDGIELSELLEETAFDGDFNITYARRPNAFNSLKQDSERSAVIISRDKNNNNRIFGMGMCSINKMLVNGQTENIGYMSGFRRKQNMGGNILQIYQMFKNYCRENNVKYTYTTILEDNLHAQKLLTKKRKLMPDYVKVADYTVNILKSNLKTNKKFVCEKAKESDLENLKSFIHKESQNKIFFPYLDLDKGFFGLNYKDFYLLKDKNGNILACGILWNQTDYKQLIVKKYSLKYRVIRKLANPILKLLNYPVLPKINEVIDYSTLSFVLYKDDKEEYLNNLIRTVSHQIKEKMFVYASTRELTEKITPMTYKSFVYIVDWDKNFDDNEFNGKNLYIECGLL